MKVVSLLFSVYKSCTWFSVQVGLLFLYKFINKKSSKLNYIKFLLNNVVTDYSWFKVNHDCSWYMFACTSLTEEGVEGVVSTSNRFVTWHLTIRLDTMLQAVQLPACISNLYTGLAHMDADTFTLKIILQD